jgi:hypothetical protein
MLDSYVCVACMAGISVAVYVVEFIDPVFCALLVWGFVCCSLYGSDLSLGRVF